MCDLLLRVEFSRISKKILRNFPQNLSDVRLISRKHDRVCLIVVGAVRNVLCVV